MQVLGYEPRGLPRLELGVGAELTGAWTVTAPADPDAGGKLLAAILGLHVYGSEFLQAWPSHASTPRAADTSVSAISNVANECTSVSTEPRAWS